MHNRIEFCIEIKNLSDKDETMYRPTTYVKSPQNIKPFVCGIILTLLTNNMTQRRKNHLQ